MYFSKIMYKSFYYKSRPKLSIVMVMKKRNVLKETSTSLTWPGPKVTLLDLKGAVGIHETNKNF